MSSHGDRVLAANRAGDTRHRVRMAAAIERRAGMIDVDAVERSGEVIE